MLTDKQFLRYQRQVALPEIAESGQVRLSESHVLIIGCGGLGSAASLYLASAGVGKLVVVDDDEVESSNLQRQVIYRERDLKVTKTQATMRQLTELNSMVQVRALNKRLDKAQLQLEVMLADVVLDCTDNMPTRQLINQVCFEQNTPLISAAAIGWQGQFAVFDYQTPSQDGVESKACYRCLYPFDELQQHQKCSQSGVVGPVVGTLGNYQALAAIQKLATGTFHVEIATLHLFDGLKMQWQTMGISKDKQCQVCAQV
ncbi:MULTISPECIES: thiazole biosynthesis adenylyltransferase ThiF [unclassified Vibrio]|uniref:thiazole biosynthesis adenylyltransferase ThiF n=1 Tax=unclassified Vibrio TaxID=2614977 RepID=UPI001361B851|nr:MULTISPECIES: thiazole biosynthesis adenylyltransferase ThiF [unclassified Vibrio]NAW57010.1 thiazole biosynthesis adenylyltransferase ThiF [Vibrio sp. V36_P2S2PM302]NAX24310.1 thiazole biosynthesis adenylyltransferase ThiF [Vibrio sp. V38_P2S17PM301]NAX31567.1 thiazole biosynthesis adenylyltransferase ThiF [Vibrio sp. V37_P2S8PM304]